MHLFCIINISSYNNAYIYQITVLTLYSLSELRWELIIIIGYTLSVVVVVVVVDEYENAAVVNVNPFLMFFSSKLHY